MIETIIFDMDGLMIDTEIVYFKMYKKAVNDFGGDIDLDFFRQVIGKPEWYDRKMLVDKFGESFPVDEVIRRMHVYSDEHFKDNGVDIKEGIVELLSYLKGKGIKMIIASSSKRRRVNQVLKDTGFDAYIQEAVCGDEVTKGKPDPEAFLKAAERMGSVPSACLVLEDSEAGIEAAHRAGIKVICVPDLKQPDEKHVGWAYRLVKSATEIVPIIEELNHEE